MAMAPDSVSGTEAGLAPAAAAAEATPPEPAAIPFFAAAVPDLADATALLTEILHGQAGEERSDGATRFRELCWQADTARIVLTESTDDPRAATPPAGIQAFAVTAGAAPDFPVESHLDGWDVTPVLPELGVRLLTQIR
jgi:hypothetical protein